MENCKIFIVRHAYKYAHYHSYILPRYKRFLSYIFFLFLFSPQDKGDETNVFLEILFLRERKIYAKNSWGGFMMMIVTLK